MSKYELPFCGLAEISGDKNQVLLRRFTGEFRLPTPSTRRDGAELRTGVVIDVETTGLDRRNDTVIELGMRCFRFDAANGEIAQIGEGYSALQDPGRPLSPEISELTGITDDDLEGKSIDWAHANSLIAGADIVIAHNAGFDRPFIDRQTENSSKKLWACTYRQIEWDEKGFPSARLEILCNYHGFFTAAHRALNDVDALLQLIALVDRTSGKPYLAELMTRAGQPYVRVVAAGSPFESKDLLKSRGYRWDGAARVWQKEILSADVEPEVLWLEAAVYRGPFRGTKQEIPVLNNFKS